MNVASMTHTLGLASSDELLSLLLHNVQDYALIILDPTGQIVGWSRGAAQVLGYEAAAVTGVSFTILYTAEDQAAGLPQQELERAMRDGRADDDNWLVRRDGSRLWASGFSTALRDADGILRGFVKIARDATAQRQLEEEHAHLLAQAQAAHATMAEALAMRDQFLSVISHELRTPITTILGQAQLLARRLGRGQGFGEHENRSLGIIAEQAKRLAGMIDFLLDVGRLHSGQFTVRLELLDLEALLRRLIEAMDASSEQHQIVLACPPPPLMVRGDVDRLEQVFQNLLQNAIKYSPAGGRVTVEVTQEETRICVAITDEGIGIPAADQARLFERFYRAYNAKSQQIKGTGIGLYVVSELVNLHGGAITVASTEGQGSTFTVCLPREDSQQSP